MSGFNSGRSSGLPISMPMTFAVEEAGILRHELNGHIDSGIVDFVFDFKDCTFIDSTGLGVIVAVYKKCSEKKGSVKLKNLNDNVRKVFMLTRLDKVLEIVD